jgi:hypothetical protein
MTYNTPELLLVGSAQNLVLGFSPTSVIGVQVPCYDDKFNPSVSDTEELW